MPPFPAFAPGPPVADAGNGRGNQKFSLRAATGMSALTRATVDAFGGPGKAVIVAVGAERADGFSNTPLLASNAGRVNVTAACSGGGPLRVLVSGEASSVDRDGQGHVLPKDEAKDTDIKVLADLRASGQVHVAVWGSANPGSGIVA